MKDIEESSRIVLKIGSALLVEPETGRLNSGWLSSVISFIAAHNDKQWIIVSSGAVALGRPALTIDKTKATSDLTLEQKQAAAAIGQVMLSRNYCDLFERNNMASGQILLSLADTEDRRSHLNARATIETLLDNSIVPVINENDSVATQEIRFGDNDRLAARVSQMMNADLLILLSTTDGLYDKDPGQHDDARHIPEVRQIDATILNYADKNISPISTGGMISKLEASKIAVEAGANVIIADGRRPDPLPVNDRYTRFYAKDTPHKARKKWIRAHLKPAGEVVVDEGAVKALHSGKSLLPVGVVEIKGNFNRGDCVLIKDTDKRLIGRGLIAYDKAQADKITGQQTGDIQKILGYKGRREVIHRDNLVLED